MFLMKTRMTTFIKTKFKISYDQTNIDKYSSVANIRGYHFISIYLTKNHYFEIYDDNAIILCKNFPVERKKIG